MSFDTIVPQIPIIALATGVISVLWLIYLEWRLARMFRGVGKRNVEQHLATIAREYQNLTTYKKEMHTTIRNLDDRVAHCIQGVGTIRFHPFAGSGLTKPSFATACISESGDGFIISTLHAHGTVSIFCKMIHNFTSEKELTQEETEALEKARKALHT